MRRIGAFIGTKRHALIVDRGHPFEVRDTRMPRMGRGESGRQDMPLPPTAGSLGREGCADAAHCARRTSAKAHALAVDGDMPRK
jgi:hypothetical protein